MRVARGLEVEARRWRRRAEKKRGFRRRLLLLAREAKAAVGPPSGGVASPVDPGGEARGAGLCVACQAGVNHAPLFINNQSEFVLGFVLFYLQHPAADWAALRAPVS